DHRDWAAPIALARDTPVAQAEIDLALADSAHPSLPRLRGRAREGAHLCLEPLRHFFFCLLDGHAIEKARIDHAAIAVIGGIGNDEGFWLDIGRAHHRSIT